MSRCRTFTQKGHKGIWNVSTWTQGRCIQCGSFLAKRRGKYCQSCSDDTRKDITALLHKEIRDQVCHYSRESIVDIIGMPLNRYLHTCLRVYF